MSASLAAFERPRIGSSNTVFKSGPLFISSKGLGWKSWKKRWFILTRTSLVFFKNDPSTLPQRGGEVNLTLGGIDLNNSGSVVVREDKKLLTVLFPDGRDGRAFTLKAETSEDLYEWKTALEHALAQAPSAALVMGHDGIFRNDATDSFEGSFHQWKDKRPVKSFVVGRPILLALEDIDGGPSFLEKALKFLEKYGTKVEGILRQSADVEEVERRVKEYEEGKTEFGPGEDAHVIGDCVKHVLRELPSSPVPASCCTALLEAYKIDRKEARVNAMRSAILETFPDPNRRLLQRILKMMYTISSHESENRMTPSAVATCMAPLLLRPLLAGECELEDDFDVNGDNSAQLLAAANAANNAQAIITTLLEEYENIFDEDNLHRCSISADSQIGHSGSEESSDNENMDIKDNGYHDAENDVDPDTDEDCDRILSGKLSESSGSAASDLYDYKGFGGNDSDVGSPRDGYLQGVKLKPKVDSQMLAGSNVPLNEQLEKRGNEINAFRELAVTESQRSMGEILSSMDPGPPLGVPGPDSGIEKPSGKLTPSNQNVKRSTFWGRSNGRSTPSTESIDSSGEEELAIQRLEITKNDLRHRIAKEARGNAILQASLERRKQALHERRLALEQDVARLQEQLQAERDLRAALEVGLSMSSGQLSGSRAMDSKTRAELEEIALAEADVARLKQKVAELHNQLNQQRQHHYGSLADACDRYRNGSNHNSPLKYYQQDFDTTLAFCNHERRQRNEELLGSDLRNMKGQILTSASGIRQPARKQLRETSLSDSKSTEASTSLSVGECGAVDSSPLHPTSKATEVMDYTRHPSAASSTLVELTTRLDFFKERRSQLMEQLHSLDLNYGSTSHQPMYKPSSPPWN
ncbi:Rho GTPase-activating protein 7 [Capsicum annuum]|uniref:rho GTPase-activating protein 7 isoform X1 n=1 Tax=Capsicum annuum TaxID=4072 RepID=UPI001FB149B9|nr:rho GTPase-activating protein 7 isoform X1 [Capsicum annuum]KAF3670315.1 Rho GTPase-activating protein 7 [Capsicum annuum]